MANILRDRTGVSKKTTSNKASHRIGIMADSHGSRKAIAGALVFFQQQACDRIYHLGDICDSFHPETADECVDMLRQNHVMAIKGNNDHTLVVNHAGVEGEVVKADTIDYLKRLPLVLHYLEAIITHALPFVNEKGLSCMIGVLGPHEQSFFFQNYPHSMLIRGHQHLPEIVWRQKHKVNTQKIAPGDKIRLKDKTPCIVTCGALDKGLCMIWEPDKKLISCHKYI
jgi:predicted phosphodiesterase